MSSNVEGDSSSSGKKRSSQLEYSNSDGEVVTSLVYQAAFRRETEENKMKIEMERIELERIKNEKEEMRIAEMQKLLLRNWIRKRRDLSWKGKRGDRT